MANVFIYSLKCPLENIRYIGKTTNLKRRLSGHISDAKTHRGKRHVTNWIYSLLKNNQHPSIHIIEICNEENWQEREKYWINYYRNAVSNLCNDCDGGLGGTGSKNYTENELEIRRQSMSKRMSKFSDENKQSIWKLVLEGKTYKEIQIIYPQYSQQMDSGIRNGRQWRQITKLNPTPRYKKRIGYRQNKGLFIVQKIVNNKKKTVFSSRIEEDVINYINAH